VPEQSLEFVAMLNELRFGCISQETIYKFSKLKRPIEFNDGVEPTELYVAQCFPFFIFSDTIYRFPRNTEVQNSNDVRLQKLASDEYVYTSYDDGAMEDPLERSKLLDELKAPAKLVLKVGAQVMLIRNLDHTLVNGSVGRVIGFSDLGAYTVGQDLEVLVSKTCDNRPTAPGHLYPVIEFPVGKSGTRKVLIQEELWTVELPDGEIQASRSQV
jgi:ATP-dependent DNA helicase PIF1